MIGAGIEPKPWRILSSDIIVGSGELKREIRRILRDNRVNLYRFCNFNGFEYDRVKAWLNSTDIRKGQSDQAEVIRVAGATGITVRVSLTVRKVDFPDPVQAIKLAGGVQNDDVSKRIMDRIKDEHDEEEW
jgi:hypothetical protein